MNKFSMNRSGFLNIIIAIIVFAVIAGGGVYLVVKNQDSVNAPSPTPDPVPVAPIPNPAPQPAPAPVPTSIVPSNWRTYANSNFGYQISYPPDFYLISTHPEFGISIPGDVTKSFPPFYRGELDLSPQVGSIQSCYTESTFGKNSIDNSQSININGVGFLKYLHNGSGEGNFLNYNELYATIHNNQCYHLLLSIWVSNNTPTESEKERAFLALRQILNTLKFTN